MARKLRLEFPGAIYHVISRGDRREDIFRDDIDRETFLETLAAACSKTSWQVQAFCLMRNHFHLVVETPSANLVTGMKWFLGTFTMRFNRRHGVVGHLFSGRYKSQLVGGEGGYLRTVCEYVLLNPVRAGILDYAEPLKSYRWSSLPLTLVEPDKRPSWIKVGRLFGEFGIPRDSTAGRRQFEQILERQRGTNRESEFDGVRSGWCFCDERFRQELLSQANTRAGPHHYGPEIREGAVAKAERIIGEELGKLRWTDESLASTPKGDPRKVDVARRLRGETAMTLEWIANRLAMGTKTYLSHLLYWRGRKKPGNRMIEPASASSRIKDNRSSPRHTVVVQQSIETKRRTDPLSALSPIVFDTSFD